jgi:hypothetical protein
VRRKSSGAQLDEDGRPHVDPATMRLAGTRLYVAGDAAQLRPLLHEAVWEGHVVGCAVLGHAQACARPTPLAIVFSEPIAIVGTVSYFRNPRKTFPYRYAPAMGAFFLPADSRLVIDRNVKTRARRPSNLGGP